jgi:hypothetical protein
MLGESLKRKSSSFLVEECHSSKDIIDNYY